MARNQKHYCLEFNGYRVSFHRSYGAAVAAKRRRHKKDQVSMWSDIVRLSDGRRWTHVGPEA